jgi:dCMP deaminase
MASQEKLDRAYMTCAFAMSELSSAVRKQVGAILVKEGIIGEGYNGTPSGFDNCCESVGYQIDGNKSWQGKDWVDDFCVKQSDGTWLTPRFNVVREVLVTLPEVLHAESNAIAKVARSNNSSIGATMYVTLCPCVDCAKMIIQAGIVRVVYAEDYRSTDGPDLLKRAGIKVERIDVQG